MKRFSLTLFVLCCVFAAAHAAEIHSKDTLVIYADSVPVYEEAERQRVARLNANDRVPAKGFKAFVEGGIAVPAGYRGLTHFEVLGSAGYQFNRYFFLGGGVGCTYYTDGKKSWQVPVFMESKVTFLDRNNTPFVDFKLGCSIGKPSGVYVAPTVGFRFGLRHDTAINIGVAYVGQTVDSYIYGPLPTKFAHGLSFKVGYEF